jgi:hypothetical protein
VNVAILVGSLSSAYTVEILDVWSRFRRLLSQIAGLGKGFPVVEEVDSSPMLLYAAIGTGSGAANISRFAIRRRFCAMAASKNSSFAPLGPRRRKRSSLRIRLR